MWQRVTRSDFPTLDRTPPTRLRGRELLYDSAERTVRGGGPPWGNRGAAGPAASSVLREKECGQPTLRRVGPKISSKKSSSACHDFLSASSSYAMPLDGSSPASGTVKL